VTTAAGTNLFQGVLTAGQSQTFRDRGGLTVVLGYAPAVDLVVNGHQHGSPPAQGSVARLTIDPRGQVTTLTG
jgi:cytoskeleton protein RodZ